MNKQDRKTLIDAIQSVWDQIGDDVLALDEEIGSPTSNKCAIEMCIDAARLLMYGGNDATKAQDVLLKAIAESSFESVISLLDRSINLV